MSDRYITCPMCGDDDIGPWIADKGRYLNWCEDCHHYALEQQKKCGYCGKPSTHLHPRDDLPPLPSCHECGCPCCQGGETP